MNRTSGHGVQTSYLNKCCGGKLNPSNWNLTSEKVMKIAGAILAICLVSILVTSLMVTYPQASGAFFTIFGLVSVAALISLVVSTIKYCRSGEGQQLGKKVQQQVRKLEQRREEGARQVKEGDEKEFTSSSLNNEGTTQA